MYYVPDGTERCGYYECMSCGSRFLATETADVTYCPYCEADSDPEVGPDEIMTEPEAAARLIKVAVGEEVEKLDMLLSLAVTGGNYEWI